MLLALFYWFENNLKSINKDVKYKKRVFNKGNTEIIKEIDNFYLEKQLAKSK